MLELAQCRLGFVQTTEGRKTTVFAIKLTLAPSDGKLKPGMPADVYFQIKP